MNGVKVGESMLSPSEIKSLIDNDSASEQKRLARIGQRYYEADHDIKDYRIFFYNSDGILQEDKTKANIKIRHPFFTENVDQEVQYILSGKDGFIFSDLPELQAHLDSYFNDNEDFLAEFEELLTGTIAKGYEYMYAYKNEDFQTAFRCADSLGVVEVKEHETDDHCEYLIYRSPDGFTKDGKLITRIMVWDSSKIYYYVQEGDGEIVKDNDRKPNPRPHTVYREDGNDTAYYEDFGLIPFFRLDNCKKQVSGLRPIKDLIDDYDLMACGLSNNIQDTNEALYVVKGYDGDDLDELTQNMKAKKHIGVGESGGVDIMTVDIPYEARKIKLELDEKNIYRFGMALNTAQLGDGNITNVVIKSRYALLDLKCNKLEIRIKQFMRKLLKIVLKEINDQNGTDFRQKDVYFRFEREVMTNAADNAQIELTDAQKQQTQISTLLNLATYLDNETLMQNICDVLDIDYNEIADRLPEQDDPYSPQSALDMLDASGGDVNE